MTDILEFILIWSLGLMAGVAVIAALGIALIVTTGLIEDFLKYMFGNGK